MNKRACKRLLGVGVACVLVGTYAWGQEGPRPAWNALDLGRPRIDVRLVPVAADFEEITDLLFHPSEPDLLVIAEKGGLARWIRVSTGQRGTLVKLAVRKRSELGLLGLVFHPKFPRVPKIYGNWNPSSGRMRTRISEWTWAPGPVLGKERVLLEVDQPYVNHDAGQLAFGPDGFLYVGLGDGGSGGDPENRAQNPGVLLGKILRLDVDRPSGGKPYGIPPDNPWVKDPAYAPEIWAIGLRNPWRYSFDPKGRLIVADVGQDAWEEISFVRAGANMGWKHREGGHCFEPSTGCRTAGLDEPWLEYGRKDGGSLTGGYVVTDPGGGPLRGLYVFGDFESGRIWAAPVPEAPGPSPIDAKRFALGKFPINPSTLGRDPSGRVYVADFSGGAVYRIEAR